MKKLIITILTIVCIVFLYMLFVVQADKREFNRLKRLEPENFKIGDTGFYKRSK